VVPLVVSFADWDRPDGGLTHVVIVGSDAEDGGLAPWNLHSGTWTDIKGYKGVGVDRTYLDALGVEGIGSHAGIDFGPHSHSLRVKALTDGIRSFTQAPYVFTTADRARQFFGVPETNSTFLLVNTAPGADLRRVQQAIASRLSDVEVLTTAEFRDRSITHWIFRTGVGVALILGTVLGVVIGVVIEAQTLYSATLDHIKEFAVLRMLGSSAGYVYRVILAQASMISLAGFALGAIAVAIVGHLSQQTALPMVVPPLLFVAMLVVSLFIGVISASIAVTKVLRIDPAAVLMR
jgi:putative ABC transport system permease protein